MRDNKKYALVTGASSGIGWHICHELAQREYSIVAVSIQAEALRQLKTTLEKKYVISVETFYCDLSEDDAATKVFEFCREKNLQVEVLVNNAGILLYGEAMDLDVKKSVSILQLHVLTPVMLCRLFGGEMKSNRKGYILNVSSISAVMPYPGISLYGPTKTFLRKYSRALRTELYDTGLSVTCLLPGATATNLYEGKNIDRKKAIKLGVMKRPEVVARAGVKALFKKRPECTPGLLNKLVILLVPIIPQSIIVPVYKKVKKKMFKEPYITDPT